MITVNIIFDGKPVACEIGRGIFLRMEQEGISLSAVKTNGLQALALFAKLALKSDLPLEEVFERIDIESAGNALAKAAELLSGDARKKKK